MKTKNYFKIIFISICAIVLQIFVPLINVDGLAIIPDIIIILLVYIGFIYGRFEAIIFGFIMGFIQDLVTQFELIGIMTFIKSLVGYCFGSLSLYFNIWSKKFRIIYIYMIFLLHFYLYQFIRLNDISLSSLFFLKIVFIQSTLSFLIFFIIDKYIIKSSIVE